MTTFPRPSEAFADTLRFAKIAKTVSLPHEAIQYFLDLSEIVAEKRRIRKRWRRYKQFGDKVELNRLTILTHENIREFCIKKFEEDVQDVRNSGNIGKLANRIKGVRRYANSLIHGRGGVKYDGIDNATAVGDCLEDLMIPMTSSGIITI